MQDVIQSIAEARGCRAFMERLERNMEKHKDVLDRLAEND